MHIQVSARKFNLEQIRGDFPILNTKINGQPLIYFDNAATSQKPAVVINTIRKYYSEQNSNVHRGVHHLSQLATDEFEKAREKVRQHINANSSREIIFTRGTTESINLVASTLGQLVSEHHNILISGLEHHSNIVPWQLLCERTGAELRVIPITDKGELDLSTIDKLLDENTYIVSVAHVSNSLGTINPVKDLISRAQGMGALVMLDGAQAIPHMKVDLQELGADFYAFSGHKCYGPTGIGVLFGKEALLQSLPPYQGGGEMISSVSFGKTTYADLPYKFEAGTPNIAGAIGLGAALDYLNELGLPNIQKQEASLLEYATKRLLSIDGIRIVGEAQAKASVISFLIGDHHPYDIGMILDKQGVALRTGHHCTQPVMESFGIPGTLRASFSFYNTKEEIDKMIEALLKAIRMLG